ncbi:MAG: hypothetical protein ACI4QY_05740 [Oscillospiraceae bacterium]
MRTDTNIGALPLTEEQPALAESAELTLTIPETDFSEELRQSEETPEKERSHVRHPQAHRSSTLIVMALSAVCGAIGGVVASGNVEASREISGSLSRTFGEIFLNRTIVGAGFLALEYVLGFFALGDLLVWSVPLAAGLGLALRIAAAKAWVLLPSSILLLFVIAFGATVSAGFSDTLMRASRGGTVHLGNSPRKLFTLNFLGYLAAAIVCALYEGIILTV